jgi:hypothetical protein
MKLFEHKWTLVLTLMLCSCLFSPLQAGAENYPYRSDYLWLTVPDHADWLYKTGERAKVEVTFCKYGIPQNVEVSYEIGQDMLPATSSGKVMLKNGRAVIDMGTMKQPGFRDLRMKATVDGKTYEHHVTLRHVLRMLIGVDVSQMERAVAGIYLQAVLFHIHIVAAQQEMKFLSCMSQFGSIISTNGTSADDSVSHIDQ